MNTKHFIYAILLMLCVDSLSQPLSSSFELRYFTEDPNANGETDFKGETAVFSTEERVDYLNKYAAISKIFFDDPNLDTRVVSDEQLRNARNRLKSQPVPSIRDRIQLKEWKWMGYKPGIEREEIDNLQLWEKNSAVEVKDGQLRFAMDGSVSVPVKKQIWRFFIQFEIGGNLNDMVLNLNGSEGSVARIKVDNQKLIIYTTEEQVKHTLAEKVNGNFYIVNIEVDFESGRYNTYVDDVLVADFVSILKNIPVNEIKIDGKKELILDNVFGVGYVKSEFTDDPNSRDIPYSINTFMDEDFELKPGIDGWNTPEYDDSAWPVTFLPHPHGGERYQGEYLYLRSEFIPGDFEKARLAYETLDPGGEIMINGRIVLVQHKRHPGEIDVTEYLDPGKINYIAVKIYPNKVEHTNRHTSSDIHTGWFAGRMHIDLTGKRYIKDVFTFTKSLDRGVATQEFRVRMINEDWELEEREIKATREFKGSLKIDIFQWYPEESEIPSETHEIPVYLRLMKDEEMIFNINVREPELWTFDRPFLYKVVATLIDDEGRPIDDFNITTGIRTVTQEGGTFRINGKPSMMNGALLFGYKSPLDKIAQWLRAGPEEWLVKEILMIKNMNANTIRMSIHHGMEGGVNDPRLAEIGDQLGVMFQWTTGSWVRTASPWLLDFEGLPKYVKQVRNHPSIVMWQTGNHPKFVDFETETVLWYEKIYQSIYPHDPSRLISPEANSTRSLARNDDGTISRNGDKVEPVSIWTAPNITRGDMDHTTGYHTDWTTLRKYPYPPDFTDVQGWRSKGFRVDYLNSPERAYFDFESEESIGQPNWNLRKGKPSYKIQSYELTYDNGTIGRILSTDEWEASQAWQAFSGFEAYKKKRWLDYDGMAWCTLHGGGNTATYQKPLIDYFGYAKLSFHAIKMVFQPTLAGSHNVDIVYGPDDTIEPVIMHLGEAINVDLKVIIKDLEGNLVDEKVYRDIALENGRSGKVLKAFRPNAGNGYYVIYYQIFQN